MIIEAVIYPDYNDDQELEGERLPYFYMHGILEKLVGYDCCNGNINAFRKALTEGLDIVNTIEFGYCLMFSYFNGLNHMEGRIVLINDLEAIKEVLSAHRNVRNGMYFDEKEYLKENHPESYKLIFKS